MRIAMLAAPAQLALLLRWTSHRVTPQAPVCSPILCSIGLAELSLQQYQENAGYAPLHET